MHHLIYLSRATVSFTDAQLQDLLLAARNHNAQLGITGILLYGNGQFVQVLEGEQVAVHALYEHIKQDTRHRDIMAYADKPIEQRAFGDWAMAFQATTPEQFTSLVGYLEPAAFALNQEHLRQADVHLIELLRSFVLL